VPSELEVLADSESEEAEKARGIYRCVGLGGAWRAGKSARCPMSLRLTGACTGISSGLLYERQGVEDRCQCAVRGHAVRWHHVDGTLVNLHVTKLSRRAQPPWDPRGRGLKGEEGKKNVNLKGRGKGKRRASSGPRALQVFGRILGLWCISVQTSLTCQ
jgi:hypothetical protein